MSPRIYEIVTLSSLPTRDGPNLMMSWIDYGNYMRLPIAIAKPQRMWNSSRACKSEKHQETMKKRVIWRKFTTYARASSWLFYFGKSEKLCVLTLADIETTPPAMRFDSASLDFSSFIFTAEQLTWVCRGFYTGKINSSISDMNAQRNWNWPQKIYMKSHESFVYFHWKWCKYSRSLWMIWLIKNSIEHRWACARTSQRVSLCMESADGRWEGQANSR